MSENELSKIVLDAAFRVHTKIGPGILESIYEKALSRDLQKRGLQVERQKPVNLVYDGEDLGEAVRLDILVENKLVVELNGSIGATGSAITIQTAHTANGGFSFPIIIKGTLGSNVASLTHNAATELRMDYSVTSSELIDNSVPISLGYGARYTQNNNTTTATTETVASLGLAGGQSTLTLNAGLNNTYAKLDIGSFSRSNNATALVRGTNMGLAATASLVGNRIVIGSGLVQIGTNTSSLGAGTGGSDKQLTIVPYFIGGTATNSAGTNFLTLDTNGTTGGLRLLGTNEQATVAAAVSGDNVKTTGVVTTTGSKTFNSLLITGSTASSLAGDNTGALNITSGALASVMTTANGDFDLSGFTGIVFGTTGANEAVITNTNTTAGGILTISSPISTASSGGGLTKAGQGLVILAAANNYTGPTTINQGTLQVGNGTNGSLDSTGTITTVAGDASNAESLRGTLSLNLANNGVLANTIVNNGAITKNTGTTVNELSGGISGSGGITVNAVGGTLALSGTQKTNTGATAINNGALRLVGNVHSTSAALNLAPTDNSGAAILQLRADADTTFQSGGVTYAGNSAARTMTIDVDQANSGNTNKKLTLAGNFLFNGYQAAANVLNVTGANGYGLEIGNLDLIPGSTTNTAPQINVTAPGGLTIASMSIGNSSGGSTGVNFTGTGNTTIAGNLTRATTSRAMTITQSGSGALTLEGSAITSTGTNQAGYSFIVSNGRLNVNNADALGVTAGIYHRLTLSGGAVLDNTSSGDLALNGKPAVFIEGNFTFGATHALNLGANGASLGNSGAANKTITVNGTTNALTLGNVTNGSTGNALTKDGTGTLALSGTAYHTGGTTVSAGTLEVNGGAVTGSTLNGTTVAPGNTDQTIAGISSTAGLRVGQSVSGTNIPAGSFITSIVNGTTIRISQGTTGAGTSSLTFASGGGLGTGAVSVTGGTLLVNSTGDINSTTGVSVTGGTFKYNGTTALDRDVTLNGGKFSYNSVNNYAGNLTFTSGTIGGSNISNLDLTINTGKTMSPGNSTGTMAAGATTWATGGSFLFELNDTTGTAGSTSLGWDLLNAASLNITAGVGEFTIQIASLDNLQAAGNALNFDGSSNYTWLFVDAGATITGFNAAKFLFNDSAFLNSTPGTFSISQGSGVDDDKLYLNYTGVIPEPSTYAMLVGGLGLLAFLRRRSKA